MKIVKLTDNLSVSEQILAVDVAAIAAAGFKVILNNRPDNEAPDQPSSAELAAAAQQHGLAYYYLPITANNFPGPDFEQIRVLLDDPASPALAFCRTGTRCTNLWVASQGSEQRPAAADQARALGYDLAMSASTS